MIQSFGKLCSNFVIGPWGSDRFSHLHLLLREMEAVISATQCEQLLVSADLSDATFFEDYDSIRLSECADPVGDCDGSTSLHKNIQRLLDLTFGLSVHGRGRFIEDQDARIG